MFVIVGFSFSKMRGCDVTFSSIFGLIPPCVGGASWATSCAKTLSECSSSFHCVFVIMNLGKWNRKILEHKNSQLLYSFYEWQFENAAEFRLCWHYLKILIFKQNNLMKFWGMDPKCLENSVSKYSRDIEPNSGLIW